MATRGAEAQGRLHDLGLGGASVTLPQTVRLGERVHLRIWAAPPVEVDGEVAWVGWADEGGVRAGVRFRFEPAGRVDDLLALLGPASEARDGAGPSSVPPSTPR
jgi:hypothetical protein